MIAVVLLAAAVALLAASEWPRISRHAGLERVSRRPRARRKTHLRVVRSEPDDSDDFAKSVERDLANLPTYDPRAKKD